VNRIRQIETFHIRDGDSAGTRFVAPGDVRSVYPTVSEWLLVRVETDSAVGWGETLAPVTPDAPKAVIDNVLSPLLRGRDLDEGVIALSTAMRDANRERGQSSGHEADAIAGVDAALWDAAARSQGIPVWRALGGRLRDRIPVYRTDLDQHTAHDKASESLAQGIRHFKLHLALSPADALTVYDAVKATLPEDVALAVDAHWIHDRGTAAALTDGLDRRSAWFLEAPVAPEDLEGSARLGNRFATPLANGEALRTRYEFAAWAAAGALAYAQPDLGRTGVTEAQAIATTLSAFHVPVWPHHSIATGIAFAAALHLSANAPLPPIMEWSPAIGERSRRFMTSDWISPSHDGSIVVPDGPGWGFRVDEDAVRRAVE
jgi:L-alanine-DL-glutamate epimerase-like enolase superfamily enzyme